MTYYTQTSASGAVEQWLISSARVLTDTAERLARYRAYRETLNELRALSDRELADLGLHRAGLKAIAVKAAQSDTAI